MSSEKITDKPDDAYFDKDGNPLTSSASREAYKKHIDPIRQRSSTELSAMIQLFIETQAAPKQDLQSAFKKCLDAVSGREKSSGSEWEDWMHDVFEDIHP